MTQLLHLNQISTHLCMYMYIVRSEWIVYRYLTYRQVH